MKFNPKHTVTEQQELERIRGKRAAIDLKVNEAIDTFGKAVPINLALESRHLSLQAGIIKLNAEIRECERCNLKAEAVRLKQRREDVSSRMKEIGHINGFLQGIANGRNEIEFLRI